MSPSVRRRPVSVSLPCAVSCRKIGRVRRGFRSNTWSAQFHLRNNGVRVSMDAPARASKADAQKDRDFVATIRHLHPSCHQSALAQVCLAAIKHLRNGGHASARRSSQSSVRLQEVPQMALPPTRSEYWETPCNKFRRLESEPVSPQKCRN